VIPIACGYSAGTLNQTPLVRFTVGTLRKHFSADNLTPFGRKKHVIQGVPKNPKTIEINVLLVNFMHKKPFKKLF
jgi:hypothetical protein